MRRVFEIAASAGLLLFAAPSLVAQVAVVQGRVEDAATLERLTGVLVMSADSSVSTLTASDGTFQIRLPAGSPFALRAERIGYVSQRFDLPPEATSRATVLRLEPQAIALPGVTVVAEDAVTELLENIDSRRNGYGEGPVWGYDRAWLNRFGPVGGTVLDFLTQRLPRIRPCSRDGAYLCIPGRVRTFNDPYPERRMLVCIDERVSIAPVDELAGLSIESVALVETIDRARVNVYTPLWVSSRARAGRVTLPSLVIGC